MKNLIPDGVAQNIASSAESLRDDAIAFIDNPTPGKIADLPASMRIMQYRFARHCRKLRGSGAVAHNQWILNFWRSVSRLLLNFDDGDSSVLTYRVDLSPLLAQDGVV